MTAFSTPAALALSTINPSFFEDEKSADEQRAEWAGRYINSQIEAFTRLWALSDAELNAELAEIRHGQRVVADERDWDSYEGYEVARYEIYAVQNNREALADEAETRLVLADESIGQLTHKPFAGLAG